MWGLSFMTIFLVAMVMWFVDHGGTIDTKMKLAEQLPEIYGRYQSRMTSGYLVRPERRPCPDALIALAFFPPSLAMSRQTMSRFMKETPRYTVNAMHTLVGNPTGYETKAAASGILNLCVSVFAMVWVTIWGAQLTSNLTVAKLAVGVAGLHELETAQLQLRTGAACSQGGAAYTNWLKARVPLRSRHLAAAHPALRESLSAVRRVLAQINYPLMQLNEDGGSIDEMTTMMGDGKCDSMLIILPAAQRLAAECGAGINLVGDPLKFGPQDFAVGVRLDMPEVTEALSYWINALRLCKADTAGSACENQENMADLFKKYHEANACAGGGGGAVSDKIGPEAFILAFILCWGVSGLALLWELCQPRFRDRCVALFWGSGLRQCVTDDPFNCLDPRTGALSSNRLRRTFKVHRTAPARATCVAEPLCALQAAFMEAVADGNLHTGAESYKKVIRCLRRHMVGPDLRAWQVRRAGGARAPRPPPPSCPSSLPSCPTDPPFVCRN